MASYKPILSLHGDGQIDISVSFLLPFSLHVCCEEFWKSTVELLEDFCLSNLPNNQKKKNQEFETSELKSLFLRNAVNSVC